MTEHRSPQADSAKRLIVSLDETSLVVAMTVVPGLYSRNKLFSLFTDPRLRRARKRAVALRTAVRQLTAGAATNVDIEPAPGGYRLVYDLPNIAYVRHLFLNEAERACVVFLLSRAGATCLPCRDEDRALVESALLRLAPLQDAPDRASGDR